VFGRAAARDFVDLMAIEGSFGLDRLFELAAEKDLGFDAGIFAEMAPVSTDCDEMNSPSTTRATSC
jgi:hypothetical protein